jgi:hypothetical protein
VRRTVPLINQRSTPALAAKPQWHIMPCRTAERKPRPTRNVIPTERQEELIETLVKSRRHQNASEARGDGLRVVEQCEVEEEGN